MLDISGSRELNRELIEYSGARWSAGSVHSMNIRSCKGQGLCEWLQTYNICQPCTDKGATNNLEKLSMQLRDALSGENKGLNDHKKSKSVCICVYIYMYISICV